MKKHNVISAIFSILILFVIIGISVIALKYWGNSLNARYGALYTFLTPFLVYVFFLIALFLRDRVGSFKISAKHFKLVKIAVIVLIAFLIIDGMGVYINRLYIRTDWRYKNYYQWLSKNELSKIRTDLNLSTPGVYPPGGKYCLVNSDVTIDRFGFRRELQDPFPELSMGQTFNILWLGGSVVFGITSDRGDITLPDMLQGMLKNVKVNNKPVRVYNAGVPGMHAEGIVNSLMKRYKFMKPDIIIFYEAINTQPRESVNVGIPMSLIYNSLILNKYHSRIRSKELKKRMKGYDPNNYGDAVDSLTENIIKLGAFPIYVTFSMPVSEQDTAFTRSYWDFMSPDTYWMAVLVRKNNEQLIKRAAKRNVTIVDSRPFLDRKREYFVDHCHLTQKGMRVMASLVRDNIVEYLKNRKPGLTVHGLEQVQP